MSLAAVSYCHTPRNARRDTGGNRKIVIRIEDDETNDIMA